MTATAIRLGEMIASISQSVIYPKPRILCFARDLRNISRYQAGNIIGKAWTRAATPTNATSGFRSTGIYPLDRNAIPEDYFLISDAATGQINTKQQQVNEDQVSKSKKSNNHRTTSPQPGTSTYNEPNPPQRSGEVDSFSPSKVLQSIWLVPVIPLTFSACKQSTQVLTSPEVIAKKKRLLANRNCQTKNRK
ncbi:hypothetical protein HHI36_009778 [Cryptolaemus montrouzieri]|uniref:Uncharacterized protein n=1 Tax=Cryptolaemus montrouzieri TaxID=559131 RepID=A0ABD2MGS1_9CUCU